MRSSSDHRCSPYPLYPMTELLKEAIRRLRKLPAPVQDSAARAMLLQLEEEPELGDREAIIEGWLEYQRGDFITLEQSRRETASE
jgi:hypothetical protein